MGPAVSLRAALNDEAREDLVERRLVLLDPDDNRSHGLNERMPVKSLYDGHEFLYRLVKTLAGGK